MNLAEGIFLYAPFPYWAIFVLVLYRHDLSRLHHPFRDDGSLRNWWAVLNYLELFDRERIPKRPVREGVLPLLVLLVASATVSLSWILGLFPSQWYYLVIVQGISAIILTAMTIQYLGTPPRRPYVDVLRFPRLGSRIRHLSKVPADKGAGSK